MLHIEGYKDMILDEAHRLYDRLLKHLTNSIMDNIAGYLLPNLHYHLLSQDYKIKLMVAEQSQKIIIIVKKILLIDLE